MNQSGGKMRKKVSIYICILLLSFSTTACTHLSSENNGSSIGESIPGTENITTVGNGSIQELTTDNIKETIIYTFKKVETTIIDRLFTTKYPFKAMYKIANCIKFVLAR